MKAGEWWITSATRVNGQAVLQFKPVDSLVATADYTYTFYKDMNQTHTFGAWFDYGLQPHQRHHQLPRYRDQPRRYRQRRLVFRQQR